MGIFAFNMALLSVTANDVKGGAIAAFFAALLLTIAVALKWMFGTKAGIGTLCLFMAAYFAWRESKRPVSRKARSESQPEGRISVKPDGIGVIVKAFLFSGLLALIGFILLIIAFFTGGLT